LLSVVTPAWNEAANLPLLFDRLRQMLDALQIDWEWVVVDDHSSDATFTAIVELARNDPRVRGLRLARNSGSHSALTCGLRQARGDCAVVMAADLQDPPEVIPQLLEQWRSGSQVVWAARGTGRLDKKGSSLALSRLYYLVMRRVVGMPDFPEEGADFFLIDRDVIEGFGRFNESHANTAILIAWMGFRQSTVYYDKQPRLHGKSGWSLARQLKLVVDSVAAFSFLPIRIMSLVGCVVAVAGFLYAGFIIVHAILGKPAEGWSSLMVVVLVVGGIQMVMMGVLGEYLWRTLGESRHRPHYLIEASTD
jgi:glycosyltransferase involved in cell wall biosynthesis